MPANNQLAWVEVRDFAPGLFTVADWLIPPNGAQIMTDCYPQPAGGLRAFTRPTSLSTVGVVDIAHEIPVGIYSRSGINHRTLPTDGTDYYLMTINQVTDGKLRLYRMDGTASAMTWTNIWTSGVSDAGIAAGCAPPTFASFVDSTGAAYVLFVLWHVEIGAGNDGTYSIKYLDGSVVKRRTATSGSGALAVQDDRIMVGEGNTLWFSDSQALTFSAPNYIKVQASLPSNLICMIQPFAPSTLLIGLQAAPWVMVQGDITNPIVRTMSPARILGDPQRGAFSTQGLAFIEPQTGVFLTSTGESFVDISSQQIDPSVWQMGLGGDRGMGDLAFQGNTLYAPNGLCFDLRTRSWFQLSDFSAAGATPGKHMFRDERSETVLMVPRTTNFSIKSYARDGGARVSTYTWKSAPMRNPDGRQIEIREVQVYVNAYATSTVTVTVNGTARSIATVAPGRQQLDFLFVERNEVLDVQVVPSANDGTSEAPSIEVVRVGTNSGHMLP